MPAFRRVSGNHLEGEGEADAAKVGEDKVVSFDKTGQAECRQCSVCGGAVMTTIPAASTTDIYPHLLKGFPFEPQALSGMVRGCANMDDGLPKFKDMPAEAGGSGHWWLIIQSKGEPLHFLFKIH